MMSAQSKGVGKKHLGPLLDFIRFVSFEGRRETQRFPRRINGTGELISETLPEARGSLPQESELFFLGEGEREYSEEKKEPFAAPGTLDEFVPQKRHRLEDEEEESDADIDGTLPVECEVITKGRGKGQYNTRYVELPLEEIGAQPFFALEADGVSKSALKRSLGQPCCYLRLGTSSIVTGRVVDVDTKDKRVQVSPDRGCDVDVIWIDATQLYKVPDNLEVIRRRAALRIHRAMARLQPAASAGIKDEPLSGASSPSESATIPGERET